MGGQLGLLEGLFLLKLHFDLVRLLLKTADLRSLLLSLLFKLLHLDLVVVDGLDGLLALLVLFVLKLAQKLAVLYEDAVGVD